MNALSAEPIARNPLIPAESESLFARNYNRENFMFRHGLGGHPLFELPNLVELTRRMPDDGEHYWSNGKVSVENTWSDGTSGRRSLQDTIRNIASNNSIVILKHTEQDPVYAPVLQNVLATMIDLSGEQMRSDVMVGEVLILVSSPGRVTPYHMDSEVNFLLQIHGDKWFHVFDHTDRTLVTDQELEEFYVVSKNTAVYRPDHGNPCAKYDLHAGFGVHIPVCAPHWVQNRDSVSVALSVNYELRSVERLQKVHRFNRRLRNLGMNPAFPTASKWRDGVKLAAERSVDTLRAVVKPREKTPYQIWTPPTAR